MAGFGGAVKLTGESEYRRALKQITQNLKEVTSEMKVVSSSYDKNDKSVEALSASQDVLTKKLEAQKSKLSTLRSQYESMESQYTDQSRAHDRLVDSYEDEKDKLDEIERTLGTASSEYKEQAARVAEMERAVDKSTTAQEGNARAMSNMRVQMNNAQTAVNNTERNLESLSSELDDARNGMNDADRAADELGDSFDDLDDSADKASSGGLGTLQVALGNLIADGIQNCISAVKDLAGEAIESSDALYKFGQTMGFAGYDDKAINKAKDDMKEYADRTVYDLDTVANTTAQLAANGIKDYTGLTQAAGNLNAVAGGNADTFGSVAMMLTQTAGAGKLTTENWNQMADAIPGASGKLQEALKNAGAYTGNFRDAMAKGEITADEFNAAIMELGNEPVAVEAATSVETFEGAVGNMQAAVVNGLMEIIDAVGMENITGFITTVTDGIEKMVPYIEEAVNWVMDNKDAIIAALAGITAGITAMTVVQKVQAMVKAFQAWKLATEGMTVAQRLLNLAMKANPIGIVITVITALVTAFIVLWNTSEDFRNFWIGLWEKIKGAVQPVIEGIVEWFKGAWDSIKSVWETVTGFFSNLWESIKEVFSTVAEWFGNMFSSAWKAIKAIWDKVIGYYRNIWTGITNIFKGAATWFGNKFRDAYKGITNVFDKAKGFFRNVWSGITGIFSGVGSWFKGKFQGAYNGITSIFNKLKGFFAGLWKNIKGTFSKLGTSLGNAIGGSVKSGINSVIGLIEGTVNKAIGLINGAINLINKLPKVNVGKVSTVSLPRLARGGVVDSGQAFIAGEAGAEIVMPLEHNTKWMRKVAQNMAQEITTGGIATQTKQADYNSAVRAFKQALSEMKVELDGDDMGRFIDRTVTRLVYN